MKSEQRWMKSERRWIEQDNLKEEARMAMGNVIAGPRTILPIYLSNFPQEEGLYSGVLENLMQVFQPAFTVSDIYKFVYFTDLDTVKW